MSSLNNTFENNSNNKTYKIIKNNNDNNDNDTIDDNDLFIKATPNPNNKYIYVGLNAANKQNPKVRKNEKWN